MTLLRRCARVLLGLLLALALGEGVLRLVAPQDLVTDGLRYEAAAGPGFRLRPGLFVPGPLGGRVNSLGLRGPEPGAKGARRRVLVLGDSFVYGAGVGPDEALPARLEALAREAGAALEFVNAGTPSYGTLRELAWLETYGDELAPDEVLLAVFVGNDVTDNLDEGNPAVIAGRLFEGDAPSGLAARLRIVRNASHLWRFLERRSLAEPAGAAARAPSAGAPPEARDEATRLALEGMLDRFAAGQLERLEVYVPEADQDDRMARGYDLTRFALEGIAHWCAERGARLTVLVVPDVMQVEPPLRERALGQLGAEAFLGDWTRPQRALAAWCAELGVACVDLLPALVEFTERSGASAYLFLDSHWNAAGHAAAAAAVFPVVSQDA